MRVIQPSIWAGMQKGGPNSPMVCGGCPDWRKCAEVDRCARASDEDYMREPTTVIRPVAEPTLISYEHALWVLSCYLAVGGPPTDEDRNRARSILYPCLSADDREKVKVKR